MNARYGIQAGLVLLAVGCLLGAELAQAQATDPKAKAALGRLQQQNQQLANQKSKLEQDNASLNKKAEEAAAQLSGKTASLARTARELREKAAAEAELKAKLAELEQQLAEAQRKEAETAATLRDRENTLAEQRQIVARQARMLQTGDERIGKLHALGGELIEKYRNKNCLDTWLEAETVTGVRRVGIENEVQSYRERLDAQKSGVAVRR
jgi:chromosome segregation ATPase